MCPAIVTDAEGNLVLVTGAAGGTIITSTTAWQIMNYLWFGKDLKESVDGRRLHHQLFPMLLQYETDFRMVGFKIFINAKSFLLQDSIKFLVLLLKSYWL